MYVVLVISTTEISGKEKLNNNSSCFSAYYLSTYYHYFI